MMPQWYSKTNQHLQTISSQLLQLVKVHQISQVAKAMIIEVCQHYNKYLKGRESHMKAKPAKVPSRILPLKQTLA